MSERTHRRGGRTIARTALSLLPLQILFRGGEAMLPLLLAAWFGRGRDTDTYYLLASYFVFVGSMVTGAFQDSAVVPVLVRTKDETPDVLPALVGALLGRTLRLATMLAVGTGLLACVYVSLSKSLSATSAAAPLAFLLALSVIVVAVRACLVGTLNALGVYRAHPVASGAGMGVTLAMTFALRHGAGICAVPIGSIAGECFAVGALLFATTRHLGVFPLPTRSKPAQLREIESRVRWEVLGTLITRINPVVDQLMVAMAAVSGGGTILRYACDIASLPTSLLQATLFPVFLTELARTPVSDPEFGRNVRDTLFSTMYLLGGASLTLGSAAFPLCTILFRHGAMDAEGVRTMANVLPYVLLGVPPFGALLVLARAHVALQNSRIMPSMGLVNASCNALFNWLFVRKWGVGGIAFSTSATYVIVALVFWFRLPRSVRFFPR